MIPLVYRLRNGVRVEQEGNTFLVVSERPLAVIRIRPRAAGILRLCDGQRTATQVADEVRGIEEEQATAICEYFRKKGVLEMAAAKRGEYLPFVTVVIPTRDRRADLADCLASVFSQCYPAELMEVIVVDDGSTDGSPDVAAQFPCRLFSHAQSRGQSYCRNLGAREASGEILAFLDSDCVAEKRWLEEMVGYFQWKRVGAVGGYVDGYFEQSSLDRYEKTFSSLNMGKYPFCAGAGDSTLYAPTCNLLVRKTVFEEIDGIAGDMRVGEDVDFCWRMRAKGYLLLYVPFGRVNHKHRNRLVSMLKRRADYGTSEALLYKRHPGKRKVFEVAPLPAVAVLAVCAAALFLSPLPLLLAALCFGSEVCAKGRKMAGLSIGVPCRSVLASVARGYLSCAYFVSFHLVRYYLAPLFLIGLLFHRAWLLCGVALAISSSVDYAAKRPRLSFFAFLFYYVLEHLSYQAGVFAGCVRERNFGSYRVRLAKK